MKNKDYGENYGEKLGREFDGKLSKEELIARIDEIFSAGEHLKATDLMRRLDIPKPTLYRYLRFLEDHLHAPLDKDFEGRYFYTDITFRVPHLMTSKSQLNAAKEMANLLEVVKGTPVYEEVKKVFDLLSSAAPKVDEWGREYDKSAKAGGREVARKIFLGAPSVGFSREIWDIISEAMEKNRNLKFNYTKVGGKVISRTVQPWQLVFDDGNWNLWAYDYYFKEAHLFTLSEMSRPEITSDTFELPEDFDFRKTTPGTFGSYTSKDLKKYRIKLEKGSYIENRATKRIWGWEQKIEHDAEGNSILEFMSNQYHPILTWVRSWGPDVEPLEPAALVEEWKTGIKMLGEKVGR